MVPDPSHRPSDPAELASRLALGDEEVLADVLRRFGPPVIGALSRRYRGVFSREDVEDILAVALHRLWRTRDRYDAARADLGCWFHAIARNVARDHLKHGWLKLRALSVQGASVAIESIAAPEPVSAAGGGGHGDSRTVLTDLNEALAALPEAQRRILEADAHAWPGVAPSAALADDLGISPGSVPVYRRRAIDSVRSQMRLRGYP
jgi:RNA polymerase sigma factor (sigma-70 family)